MMLSFDGSACTPFDPVVAKRRSIAGLERVMMLK